MSPPRFFKYVTDKLRQPSGGIKINPSWVDTAALPVTAINTTTPITSTGGAAPTLGISPASGTLAGSMSISDFVKLSAATATNTPSTIVGRDGGGNVAFGTATGNLVGTASNATNLNNQSAAYYLDRANHAGTQASGTIGDFDTRVRSSRLDQLAAPTAAVSLNNQKITGLAAPAIGSDGVNRTYADALIDGPPIGSSGGVSIRGYSPIVVVSVGTKPLTLLDGNTTQNCTATTTITIPLNATVPYPIGTEITILRNTSGTITLNPTAGVTVTNRDGAVNTQTTVRNYTLLKKTATDTWIAVNPIPDSAFLAGNPTATTQPAGTNDTTIATTAHVAALVSEPRAGALRVGAGAASSNTTGNTFVAIGPNAALSNTTGNTFVAIGPNAALSNATATQYVAIGPEAARLSVSAIQYVAIGYAALYSNTSGINNVAIGAYTLYDNLTGSNNTGVGFNIGRGITTGGGNTIIGANVTGLPAALTNNVILASGDGFIGLQINAARQTSVTSFLATASTVSTSTTTGSIQTTGVGIGGGRGSFSLGIYCDDSAAASQINRSLYFNNGNTWAKRGDGSNVALSPLSLAAPIAAANVVTVPFDGVRTVLAQYNVVGPVALTPATTRIQGAQTILVVSADGTNIPALAAGVRLFTDSATYSNVAGTLHVYTFYEISGTVWVRISRIGASSSVASSRIAISPLNCEYPATANAIIDTANARPCIAFISTSATSGIWSFPPLRDYADGGLTITLECAMVSATTGNVAITAAIESHLPGTDTIVSDSFATAISSGAVAVPATAGLYFNVSISLTSAQLDGLTNSTFWRLRLTRDTTAASNATGNLRLSFGEVRS